MDSVLWQHSGICRLELFQSNCCIVITVCKNFCNVHVVQTAHVINLWHYIVLHNCPYISLYLYSISRFEACSSENLVNPDSELYVKNNYLGYLLFALQ